MSIKKMFSLFLMCMVALSMLAGCGSTGDAGSGEPAAAAAAAGDVESTSVSEQTNAESSSDDENAVLLWAFTDPHARYFEWVGEEYKKEHPDFSLNVEVMNIDAMDDRLSVIISSGGEGSPDFVDMEQGHFPRYMFEDKICFEPLSERIKADGIDKLMVESRLSLYKYNDEYYGLEHALCPVTMAYRKDMFEEYDIKVPTTWDEYKQAAEQLKEHDIYIASRPDMRVGDQSYDLNNYLLSAGQDLVADDGSINISDELKMLLTDFRDMQQKGQTYAYETDEERWVPMRDNQVATYFTADWAAGWLRDNVPEQSGQWAMSYLPKLDDSAAPTSCNGGTGLTMMSYTQKDKDALWDFMKFAMTNTENSVEKFEMINLYPAVYEAMPLCGGPVEYYGDQDLGALYAEVAPDMPTQNQAAWRGQFLDAMNTYMYDFYEGNITVDEFLDNVVSDVEAQQ